VARLGDWYTPDARFKDPFNEVQGVAAIQRIFAHMFESLDEPRFVIREAIVQGDQCFLSWDFLFRMKRCAATCITVHGGSHLVFARRRPCRAAPRLLGRRRGAVREAAAGRRPDALAEASRRRLNQRWPSVSVSSWKRPERSTSQMST
jgi:hypothetical protein